jgi:hypothetical protein
MRLRRRLARVDRRTQIDDALEARGHVVGGHRPAKQHHLRALAQMLVRPLQ